MAVELGDKCRDTITDFVGICVSITEYINGCIHIGIEAANPDGTKERRSLFDTFDIARIEVIEPGAFKPQDHGVNVPGGPADGRTVRVEDATR